MGHHKCGEDNATIPRVRSTDDFAAIESYRAESLTEKFWVALRKITSETQCKVQYSIPLFGMNDFWNLIYLIFAIRQ